MMTLLPTALAQLETGLSEDPYRLDLLFSKALVHISQGDLSLALQIQTILSKLPGMVEQKSLLSSILSGSRILVRNERLWFVFSDSVTPQVQRDVVELANINYKRLCDIKGEGVNDTIVIEISSLPISVLDYTIEGLSHIRLSSELNTADKVSSALAHELSHVFWPCKNRVLSEGIALYFENMIAPNESFIRSRYYALNSVEHYSEELPTIEFLLSNCFTNDVFFTENTGSSDEQFLIYSLAYLLIERFMDVNKAKDVAYLTHKINAADEFEAIRIFASFFDGALPEFFEAPIKETSCHANDIHVFEIESTIREDRVRNEQHSFDKYYDIVSANSKGSESDAETTIIKIRLLLAKLYEQINHHKPINNLSLSMVENLTNTLDPAQFAREHAYFSAKVTLVRLIVSDDIMEKFRLRSLIDDLFTQSLGEHLLETEAYIDYAKFELATPRDFGRDIAKAKMLYHHIKSDTRYQVEIDRLRDDINRELLCA